MRRHYTIVFVAVLLMASGTLAQAGIISLTANLTNGQENPPILPSQLTDMNGNPRPASFGTATFTLDDVLLTLTVDATITNIDVTGMQTADPNDNLMAAHIHASSDPNFTPLMNAGVVWGFFGMPFNNNNPTDQVNTPFAMGVGGSFHGVWNAPEGNMTTLSAQIANILAGRSYINFHTMQFGGGETRGAIVAQQVPEPATIGLLLVGTVACLRRMRRVER
jgi:CHRD domain/PEP-CTERM motif